MIKESLKTHGKRQFEVKQKVSFTRKTKEVRYQVETYFFIPTALQINRHTYTSAEFIRSLKNYIRLRPPTKKLRSLCAQDGVLDELKQQLITFSQQENPNLTEYENTLKRYALTYKRSLRLAIKTIRKNTQKRTPENVEILLNNVEKSLEQYRSLANIVCTIETKIKSSAFSYCDEYISYITISYLREMLTRTDIPPHEKSHQLWRREMLYHKEHFQNSQPQANRNNEMILYRWSIIKKYVSHYLFLDIRYKSGTPLLLHSIYGIAAALSMIFATIIAFLWQGQYGALSINLFLALVIGYIFKDRIKEVGRIYLFQLFQNWIPDRRFSIFKDKKKPIGTFQESFRFLKDASLPEDIREIREQSHWIKLINDQRTEDILLYKKGVTLHNNPELFEQTQYSIIDITRFNISDFLRHADNAFEELPVQDENEETQITYGEHIYHIYIARRVIFNSQVAYDLARLVVNAEGIKRLEILQKLQYHPQPDPHPEIKPPQNTNNNQT